MKKQLPFLILLGLIGAFVFSLEGCGPDPESPCKDKKTVSAEFIVAEQLLSVDTLIDEDTLLTGRTLTFKAKNEYQTYEWRIGSDPRVFTTRSVSLFFEKSISAKNIDVKLKVKDSFLESCFPNKGEDSLTKRIVLLPSTASATFGRYEGSLDEDPTNKFIITIRYCQPGVNGFICTNNINKGCDNNNEPPRQGPPIESTFSYKAMKIGDTRNQTYLNAASGNPETDCNDPQGWLYFQKSINSVIVEYTTGDFINRNSPRKKHRFTGKRI